MQDDMERTHYLVDTKLPSNQSMWLPKYPTKLGELPISQEEHKARSQIWIAEIQSKLATKH